MLIYIYTYIYRKIFCEIEAVLLKINIFGNSNLGTSFYYQFSNIRDSKTNDVSFENLNFTKIINIGGPVPLKQINIVI